MTRCAQGFARDQILACREAGVADFILKPFSIDRVLETLQAVASRVTPFVIQQPA